MFFWGETNWHSSAILAQNTALKHCILRLIISFHLPMQEGSGLSQALLSPVMHLSVVAPCSVYPGSQRYVMLLPEKWPWSLTLKPNCGTPGSSQWDNSKPGEKRERVWQGRLVSAVLWKYSHREASNRENQNYYYYFFFFNLSLAEK